MWKLIQRYISGQSTRDEDRKVERWMEKDPANSQIISELKQIWELTPDEDFNVNVEKAWSQFQSEKIKKKIVRKSLQKAAGKKSSKVVLFRVAAVFLLAAFVGFFSWKYLDDYTSNNEKAPVYAMQRLVTRNGEKAQVTFSDGTKVTLNVASSLRFPKAFAGAKREVYLNGEAYFEVAHNKDRPFIVHTAKTNVQVLGTKFNVQAWKEDRQAAVGVRQGKVGVSLPGNEGDNSSVFLTNGEYATINNKQLSAVQHGNIDNFTLWLGGGLYFNDAPFLAVVRQIERKFDVHISVKDTALMKVPFTGTFKNAGLDEVLKVVSASMGLRYRLENSSVVLIDK